MDKVDKYLKESKEKDALKSWNSDDFTALRDSYYGVMENIETLASQLNALNGDTGLFGKDLNLAVKGRDAFRKLTLGKYV
jgi:hypothetical protein